MGLAVRIQEQALLNREAGYRVVAAKARFSWIPRFATPAVTVVLQIISIVGSMLDFCVILDLR